MFGAITAAVGGLPPWAWRCLAYALIALGFVAFGAFEMHEHDAAKYEKLQHEYITFKTQAAALGKVAQAAADKQKAKDEELKTESDKENKVAYNNLRAERNRLFNARARGNYLPPAPASAREPDKACFGRTELNNAIRQLDEGVQSLITKGDEARIDQLTNMRWAQRLGK